MATPRPNALGLLQGGNPYLNPGSLPGLKGLTESASGIIQSELSGMPNPAETRTANAAWGVANGLAPAQGMDFLNQRGSRLYRSEIENRQRNGIQDFLRFLQGLSGTVSATPGQILQTNQQGAQNSFENAMALMERQLEQRQMQDANQPVYDSYSTSGAGPGGGGGLFHGYETRRRR